MSGLVLNISVKDAELNALNAALDRLDAILSKPSKANLSGLNAQIDGLSIKAAEAQAVVAGLQASIATLSAESAAVSKNLTASSVAIAETATTAAAAETKVNLLTISLSSLAKSTAAGLAATSAATVAMTEQGEAVRVLQGQMASLPTELRAATVATQGLAGVTGLLNSEQVLQAELATIAAAAENQLLATMKAETTASAKLLLDKGLITEARYNEIAGVKATVPAINLLTASYSELAVAEQASAAAFAASAAAQKASAAAAGTSVLSSGSTEKVSQLRAQVSLEEMRNAALAEGVRLEALMLGQKDAGLAAQRAQNIELAKQAKSLGLISTAEYKAAVASNTHVAAMEREAVVARNLNGVMRGLSGAMGTLWLSYGAVIPLLAAFATATAVVKGFKEASDFQYTTKYIESLGKAMGDTTISIEGIRGGLLAIGDVAQGPNELAGALKSMVKAGFDVSESLRELPVLARLATVAEEDLATTTSAVISQYRAWSAEAIGAERGLESMSQASNVLAYAALSTTLDIGELLKMLKYTPVLAQQSNASFVEVAAALGTMSNMGIRGTTAATSLRTAMIQLQNPTNQTKEMLAGFGVELKILDEAGKKKTMTALFDDLGKSLQGLSEKQRINALSSMFSIRAISAGSVMLAQMSAAVKEGTFSFSKQVEALEKIKREGTFVNDMYADLTKTTKVLWGETKAAWEKSALEGLDADSVRDFVVILKDFAESGGLTKFFEAAGLAANGLVFVMESLADQADNVSAPFFTLGRALLYLYDATVGASEGTLAAMHASKLYSEVSSGVTEFTDAEYSAISRLTLAYGSLATAAKAERFDARISSAKKALSELEDGARMAEGKLASGDGNEAQQESYRKQIRIVAQLKEEIGSLRAEKEKMLADPEAWQAEQDAVTAARQSKRKADLAVMAQYEAENPTLEVRAKNAKLMLKETQSQNSFELALLAKQHSAKLIAEEDFMAQAHALRVKDIKDKLSVLALEKQSSDEKLETATTNASLEQAPAGADRALEKARADSEKIATATRIAQAELARETLSYKMDLTVWSTQLDREGASLSLEIQKSRIEQGKTLEMTSISHELALLEGRKAAGLTIEGDYLKAKHDLQLRQFEIEAASLADVLEVQKKQKAEALTLPGVDETDASVRQLNEAIWGTELALKAVAANKSAFQSTSVTAAIARTKVLRDELEALTKASARGVDNTNFELSIRTLGAKEQELARTLHNLQLAEKDKVTELGKEYSGPELEAKTKDTKETYNKLSADTLSQADAEAEAGKDFWAGMKKGVNDYADDAQTTFELTADLTSTAFNTMSDALTEFVTTGKLDIKSLASTFLAEIAKMIAMQLVLNAVKGIASAMGGGSGAAAGAVASGVSTAAAADGAIWGGHFEPIQAFANGSARIDKPTLGLVGEGRYPEAIVPLPDGRSIPARIEGMGEGLDAAFSKFAQSMGSGSKGGDTKIINVLDPTMVKGYLGTREGEKLIVNIMRENRGALS